jgi:non-canonical (house-cleaning) NTP pyrophosphatase
MAKLRLLLVNQGRPSNRPTPTLETTKELAREKAAEFQYEVVTDHVDQSVNIFGVEVTHRGAVQRANQQANPQLQIVQVMP